MNKEEYFRRQIQLWGEEAQERLSSKRIVIVGCGGLGSTLVSALGGSGIGEIHLVDFDRVSSHNIHRQIVFTLEDEGLNKAEVSARLLRKRNPFVQVYAHPCDFSSFIKSDPPVFDLILDATDNLEVRAQIDAWAKSRGTPWIYASVEEFNGQVCFFERADFGIFSLSDHKPGGIAAAMVMQIGSFQADLALRYLAGLPICKDQLYYLYYDEEGEIILKRFRLPVN